MRRNLIKKGFIGKGVLHAAGGANPRRFEGRALEPMRRGFYIIDGVRNGQVLNDAAGTQGAETIQPRMIGTDQGDEACTPVRDKKLRFPGGNLAAGIEARAHIEQGRRSFRVPTMLIGPHPLHPHRRIDRTRE